MGTNCDPLLLIYSCFVMKGSLSDDMQADIIDAFNITSRYLVNIF